MSNYEPCVRSARAAEASLLAEEALTERTYGDSRSERARSAFELAWRTSGLLLLRICGDSRIEKACNPAIYHVS